jgi:hypothetical protein
LPQTTVFKEPQYAQEYMKTKPSSIQMSLPLLAFLGWALAVAPWLGTAQDLPFDSGSTGADGPLTFRKIVVNGRNGHGTAFDSVHNQLVLFGGWAGVEMGDTWVWDGDNWVQKLPATSPLPRYSARMVWDDARKQVLLFGGNRQGARLGDTWVWDGTTWTQKTPANSPTARDYHAMAYDAAHQRVVLFGGNGGADETWLWDGSNWTMATPAHKPPSHSNHALAYDAARQRTVLFGAYGQTWLWDGNDWTQAAPPFTPQARSYAAMDYDPVRQVIVLAGGSYYNDTWTWDGTTWTQLAPAALPGGRQAATLTWDQALQRIVLVGGDNYTVDSQSADTWLWNGTTWAYWSGKNQVFNMSSRANGVWNFTSIEIPPGVTVRFNKNDANTPIRWLATDTVTINGAVDVSGDLGANSLPPGSVARGGPGGYDGGRGGIKFTASQSYVGRPGQGPGGGVPGTAQQTNPTNLRDGQDGQYVGTYGNLYILPLVGGSGGGGGSSSDTVDGGNGGGGGGAILISSSRDLMLNGKIAADGGDQQWSGASVGGRGAGGAILLRADRVTGSGTLEAFAGNGNYPTGRIRVEAYERTLTGTATPTAVVALPSTNGELNQAGVLTVASINAQAVPSSPSGNLSTPDVVFAQSGPVTIVVQGIGIPDGTPVTLRVATTDSVISSGPQNMTGGSASFNVTVPKGLGTVQATASVTQ